MSKGVLVKRGDYGNHVVEIQKALKNVGLWLIMIPFSKTFGPATEAAVEKFQNINGLVVDGVVGRNTANRLGVHIPNNVTKFDEKYKNVTIEGSRFLDKPLTSNLNIKLNKEMVEEYLPAMEKAMGSYPKGFKLLITIMAFKEGFRERSRSYRYNNPGNIGNTDSGANAMQDSLVDGIYLQRDYIESIVNNEHKAYPMGEIKVIKPFFSKEIAKHSKMYGMSPYVPGYTFKFTGQLDQFVKIYSTGARAGNGYVNMIVSYFKKNGIEISPSSKIQDIIKMM